MITKILILIWILIIIIIISNNIYNSNNNNIMLSNIKNILTNWEKLKSSLTIDISR